MKPIIKKLLREALITKEESDIRIIADFTNFAKEFLGINDDIKVKLAFERTPDLKTTAYYNTSGFLVVYVKDRAIVDVIRSLAHELVHHKQNLEGRLKDAVKDGEDGSPIENEANAKAGEIVRRYGKLNPEIYV
jgi:Zn-dependent peptidase ImmA (M78 family)